MLLTHDGPKHSNPKHVPTKPTTVLMQFPTKHPLVLIQVFSHYTAVLTRIRGLGSHKTYLSPKHCNANASAHKTHHSSNVGPQKTHVIGLLDLTET